MMTVVMIDCFDLPGVENPGRVLPPHFKLPYIHGS